ncbi:ADP-ribosyl-[dinitrogen reductase] glycohydrolase [Lachnospiraceae bacterium]|nr:ADP-ribosyl-[dinitrogen reductase] glycohydrolase [Lachnospiraceae bacterium]
MKILKKICDGMIGLAIGDAIGVPVEFKSRQEIAENPVISMREYGTHYQPMGTWSDDTSLALALMDSIIKKNKIDYVDIMNRFSDWLLYNDYTATGEVFDVGNSTSRAIMNYGRGMNPLECGGISEYENGNGSLMRILPIAFYLKKHCDLDMESQMEIVHNISALTHRHRTSLIGCGIYINIAMNLLEGRLPLYESIEQGIKTAFAYYERKTWNNVYEYLRLMNLSDFLGLPDREIKSSGYVIHTLESALWCLLKTHSYTECVFKAVNLGEDTDTVGAVAGGLAGIYYGLVEIPEDWLKVLARRQYIEELCEKFYISL